MRLELAIKSVREMWFFCRKSAEIWPVIAVAESQSGNTIDTMHGQRLRTNTKTHAVFNNYDFARIAQKDSKNEIDAEYDDLLARNKLRRIK